ncbi:MAG: hypothetical protein JWM95_2151 [Gemmatimonadetes bacterium]|nr:hypothetical protein [Gemmatimonadota bacterium]
MRILTAVLVSAILSPAMLSAQTAAPTTGAQVLERMRLAYEGKWYHTLTFAQKTTMMGRDGAKRIQSWRESLRHDAARGTQLRIDFGNAADGNGVLYTPDSSWRVVAGQAKPGDANGNAFLPLIEGVYVQPVAKTIAELASTHVDMSKVSQRTSQGKPVWVVGSLSASDSTSPQFWIDAERNVVVRMILQLAPGADPYDVHLDDYVPAGKGMLATKVTMYIKGAPAQIEEYADWKTDVPLSDALFNLSAWKAGAP